MGGKHHGGVGTTLPHPFCQLPLYHCFSVSIGDHVSHERGIFPLKGLVPIEFLSQAVNVTLQCSSCWEVQCCPF